MHDMLVRTRLLRANLLQPLKDIETINTRLDCLVSIVKIRVLYTELDPLCSYRNFSMYDDALIIVSPYCNFRMS